MLHSEACVQRPFIENVTALIKMWRFLEGILLPSAVKKGEAESGALNASRCDGFLEDLSLPSTEKMVMQELAPLGGKTYSVSALKKN